MIVRCGRCQTSFEVEGPGRYPCPACGTATDVRVEDSAAGASDLIAPPPPPKQDSPSPRAECGECGLSFIVGAVAAVPCPNCGTPVTVSGSEGDE